MITLQWQNTLQEVANEHTQFVVDDLIEQGFDHPRNMVFHLAFLTDDVAGPCVVVREQEDSDMFYCEYQERVQWGNLVRRVVA